MIDKGEAKEIMEEEYPETNFFYKKEDLVSYIYKLENDRVVKVDKIYGYTEKVDL